MALFICGRIVEGSIEHGFDISYTTKCIAAGILLDYAIESLTGIVIPGCLTVSHLKTARFPLPMPSCRVGDC